MKRYQYINLLQSMDVYGMLNDALYRPWSLDTQETTDYRRVDIDSDNHEGIWQTQLNFQKKKKEVSSGSFVFILNHKYLSSYEGQWNQHYPKKPFPPVLHQGTVLKTAVFPAEA